MGKNKELLLIVNVKFNSGSKEYSYKVKNEDKLKVLTVIGINRALAASEGKNFLGHVKNFLENEKVYRLSRESLGVDGAKANQSQVTIVNFCVASNANDYNSLRTIQEIYFHESDLFQFQDYKQKLRESDIFSQYNKKGGHNMGKKKVSSVGQKLEGVFGLSLLSGESAVRMGNSFYSLDKETRTLTNVGDFVLELPFPGIVISTTLKDLRLGDVLLQNGELVWVSNVESDNLHYSVLNSNGEEKDFSLVKDLFSTQGNFVEKVFNPMDKMKSVEKSLSNLGVNPMFLMMMDNPKMLDMATTMALDSFLQKDKGSV